MISSKSDDPEHGEDPLEAVATVEGEGSPLGLNISEAQFPLILVLATSFVLMLAVFTWEGEMKSYGYAVSVPIISMLLSLTYLTLTVFKANLYALYAVHATHVLFMWNLIGACFLTFSSPFITTGNGYFAAWGCVVTSAMAMGFTGDAFRSKVEGLGSLLGLAASSGIVIIALIDYVGAGAQAYSRAESLYAMVISVFTVLLVVGIMYSQNKYGELPWYSKAKFGSLTLFAILWLVLACLVTFSGPFNTTGNGYFASWVGAACICFATYSSWTELGIAPEDVVGFLSPASNADGPTGLSATIT
jgi:hypothetical protein